MSYLTAPLALDEAAIAQLEKLPPLHGDSFDRMLICQANAHGLVVASSDALIYQYPANLS